MSISFELLNADLKTNKETTEQVTVIDVSPTQVISQKGKEQLKEPVAELSQQKIQKNIISSILSDFSNQLTVQTNIPVLATNGHPQAQYQLGISYKAIGEYEKASDWFKLAAEQGHPDAQYNLGEEYEAFSENKDVQCELEKRHCYLQEAGKWYKEAAKQGHPGAQYKLGCLYKNYPCFEAEKFELMPRNIQKMCYWIRCAAVQEHAEAQCMLGTLYEMEMAIVHREDGTELRLPDKQEAFKWYVEAGFQENPEALYKLGLMYEYHDSCYGVITDMENGKPIRFPDNWKAADYYKEASALGHQEAEKSWRRIQDKQCEQTELEHLKAELVSKKEKIQLQRECHEFRMRQVEEQTQKYAAEIEQLKAELLAKDMRMAAQEAQIATWVQLDRLKTAVIESREAQLEALLAFTDLHSPTEGLKQVPDAPLLNSSTARSVSSPVKKRNLHENPESPAKRQHLTPTSRKPEPPLPVRIHLWD